MQDYEIPTQFYLGRKYDLEAGKANQELLLYDSKDLVTHAVCVGMTGSGKTGLCLALLEEAAIDGIPAIIIDPKGDLGNLLLTFPNLQPSDFQPWIDPGEPARKGKTLEELATHTAATWKKGLAEWGQPPERIQKFREAVEITIYTPGSNAGVPLTVLKSFAAPGAAVLNDSDALREKINGAVAGLLALLGIEGDPLRSREHILLSTLVDTCWREGKDLELGHLIRDIQQPPFEKVGFLDLESFFPQKERFELSMAINNLLASPGFAGWMNGEPLDIQRLFYSPNGKPRFAILSIAHLSDAERMFFVTMLLNELIAWMRAQTGTTSLRALLYMDEVFGYFPPTANPPSKTPMLTLLKQARAFGLGVVLATQNPVDIDYKGLSNAGTWFIGRLQTERDKLRVLDGLEGASSQAGANFDRATMDRILSGLGNRVFLMNNVHEDAPTVFQTRWALSFLRGPISSEQIRTLMTDRKQGLPAPATTTGKTNSAARPVLPPGISEIFLPRRTAKSQGMTIEYRPALYGEGKIHFVKATDGVDHSEPFRLLALNGESSEESWTTAESWAGDLLEPDSAPEERAAFALLPAALTKAKSYSTFTGDLRDALYRTRRLNLWKFTKQKVVSKPGESEGDFRVRLSQTARELRDEAVEKLRLKYKPKLAALEERLRKAEQKVAKEKENAKQQTIQTVLSVGSSILGAVFGRKIGTATNVGKAATSMRTASKVLSKKADIDQAEDNVEVLQQRIAEMDAEFNAEVATLDATVQPDKLPLDELVVQPKKTDIDVERVVLAWVPYLIGPDGRTARG